MATFDRPPPGEEPNTEGGPTVPRPAATVVVVRGGPERLEVLLVQRTHAARFLPGTWVFPGGALDPGEDVRAAAVRELREEAGIATAPEDLVPYSRWITPEAVRTRFDTWFFLVAEPPGAQPRVDGTECVDLRWSAPRAALDEGLKMIFPTIKHLEQLARFASADALLEHARGRDVEPVVPKVVLEGEVARVLLPGEPGYESAA